ncbi:MAG: hypothetical protein ABH877_04295 [bacterium]
MIENYAADIDAEESVASLGDDIVGKTTPSWMNVAISAGLGLAGLYLGPQRCQHWRVRCYRTFVLEEGKEIWGWCSECNDWFCAGQILYPERGTMPC